MKRREFITLLGGAAATWPLAARAQPKIPRVGFMGNSTAALEANLVSAFRDGLRERGYEEGRNIIIEYRWADGKYERFPALVAEHITAKVDVIVTAGTPAALAVKKATTTVPLIMVAVGGSGRHRSRAEPGAARWQSHGTKLDCARPRGQAAGYSARSRAHAFACRRILQLAQSLPCRIDAASARRCPGNGSKIATA
jgi:hypothetical protein